MKRIYYLLFTIVTILICMETMAFGQDRRQPRNMSKQEILFLTPEQEAEVMAYVKSAHPEKLDQFMSLKDSKPMVYRRMLTRGYREMRLMTELKERDPERYSRVGEERKLESKSQALVRKMKATEDEEEKLRLRPEIERILNQVFDLRQSNRQMEIERLEKKLSELKENNQKRLASKEEILKRRLTELLGEEKGLEW